MAVFMEGEIQQIGAPAEVFAKPNSVDVAAFIGSPPMNLFPARLVNGAVLIADRRIPTLWREPGEREVVVGIRPGAVRIEADGIPAVVDLVENLGDTAVLDLDLGAVSVRARVSEGQVPKEGDAVAVAFRPEDIHLFDATTRQRL
jgi:ABC-type sugar transport system ATPase subunit